MTVEVSKRPPLSPREGWLSNGRQVLHFRPTRWESRVQRLEITTGELLLDQEIPLLKSRRELSRAAAHHPCGAGNCQRQSVTSGASMPCSWA
jgi:hypothetical protein